MAKTLRIKVAGSGGQGVLSLGLCLAQAAVLDGLEATWLPSYGPEQRGGVANCSIVISSEPIASPIVEECDLLVCLNAASYARFAPTLAPTGVVFADDRLECEPIPQLVRVPAQELAEQAGIPKAANTVFYATLAGCGRLPITANSLETAIFKSLKSKPDLVQRNVELYRSASKKAAR